MWSLLSLQIRPALQPHRVQFRRYPESTFHCPCVLWYVVHKNIFWWIVVVSTGAYGQQCWVSQCHRPLFMFEFSIPNRCSTLHKDELYDLKWPAKCIRVCSTTMRPSGSHVTSIWWSGPVEWRLISWYGILGFVQCCRRDGNPTWGVGLVGCLLLLAKPPAFSVAIVNRTNTGVLESFSDPQKIFILG